MTDPCGADCREVLESVWLYLDGEATDERTALVRDHLDECVACLRAYGYEREVRLLVARCCGGDRAPAELRQKVLTRIRTVHVETVHLESAHLESAHLESAHLEFEQVEIERVEIEQAQFRLD